MENYWKQISNLWKKILLINLKLSEAGKNYGSMEYIQAQYNRIFYDEPVNLDLPNNVILHKILNLKIINCSFFPIDSLTPLLSFKFLMSLNLKHTKVDSLRTLESLHTLESLDCSKNNIKDLMPISNNLILRNVNCSRTEVSTLEALKNLKALQTLNLRATKVKEIDSLRGLSHLQSLNISDCEISQIDCLEETHDLNFLYIDNTRVKNIEPILRSINTSLQVFSCKNCNISKKQIKLFMDKFPACIIYS